MEANCLVLYSFDPTQTQVLWIIEAITFNIFEFNAACSFIIMSGRGVELNSFSWNVYFFRAKAFKERGLTYTVETAYEDMHWNLDILSLFIKAVLTFISFIIKCHVVKSFQKGWHPF